MSQTTPPPDLPGETTSDVAQRLANWRRTGDPASLWPNVRSDQLTMAHSLIARTTSAVLRGTARKPTLGEAGSCHRDAIGIAAFVSGMGPLLGYWIEAELIDADEEISGLLHLHLQHSRERVARINTAFLRLLEALNDRGLAPIVFKGIYTSRSYFPEPATRPIADIDLLVEAEQRTRAAEALRATGFVELGVDTPGQTAWRLPSASESVHSLQLEHRNNPWAVDLHTTIDKRYFRGCWASFGPHPFRSANAWNVDGLSARVFGQPLLTAHLAQHATYTIHELRLVRLVELILVTRRDIAEGTLEWDSLAAFLRETGTTRFVYPALELAERITPGLIEPAFRHALAAASTRRMRRVIDHIAASGMHMAGRGTVSERFVWARGPWEVTKNFTDFIWPPARSASERWRKYGKWLRMAMRGRLAMRS